MKKIYLLTTLFVAISISLVSIIAQQNNQSQVAAFKPGWFIGANGGLNWFLAEGNDFIFEETNRAIFLKNTGYQGRLFVGYKFNPILALKVGGEYNNYVYYTQSRITNVSHTRDIQAPKLNVDLLVNLSNLNAYNPTRKLDFSVFAGLGGLYLHQNVNSSKIGGALRGGVQLDYKLTPTLSLNAIADANLLTDNANDGVAAMPIDVAAGLAAGITYHIREKRRPKAIAADENLTLIEIVPEKPIVATQPEKTIEIPESEKPKVAVVDTPKQVIPTPAPKPQPQITSAPEIKESIQFRFNSRIVEGGTPKETIARIVDYLKKNPTAKVVVSGYADSASGTEAINNEVSRQRALHVATKLVKENGVDPKRVMVKWFGSKVQPYTETWKNRLVIVNTPTEDDAKNFKPMDIISSIITETATKVEIQFDANKQLVSESQREALKRIANYLTANPDATVQVSGYASASSGTVELNDALSKKRAIAVANMLITEYGINFKRIHVSWFGARVQPYRVPTLNQLVVVQAK